jgi:hypothetical protein
MTRNQNEMERVHEERERNEKVYRLHHREAICSLYVKVHVTYKKA